VHQHNVGRNAPFALSTGPGSSWLTGQVLLFLPDREPRTHLDLSRCRCLSTILPRVVAIEPYSRGITVEPLGFRVAMPAAIRAFSQTDRPAVLESSLYHPRWGRYSILTCDPVDEFVVSADDGICPFSAFADQLGSHSAKVRPPIALPFFGGWIGYFAFEASGPTDLWSRSHPQILGAERTTYDGPLARFHLYDSAVVLDHRDDTAYVVTSDVEGIANQRPARRRLRGLRSLMLEARAQHKPRGSDSGLRIDRDAVASVVSDAALSLSLDRYMSAVRAALRYIAAGDVFQVNLAQRFTLPARQDALKTYLQLRELTPSYCAAFLPWGAPDVISASPELFLRVRNGRVLTRPIKGTRPRGANASADARLRRELERSEKDGAELAMIVDLLRNDLGRVCEISSIRVQRKRELETHPTVFHQVATIRGRLEPEKTSMDLLRATFPGGSITGAPKLRAMQIIRELEPVPRGVYCGAIGIIGLDGSLCLNLPIRTILQSKDRLHLHAGSGIVADSTAESEWLEVLAKAAAPLAAAQPGSSLAEHELAEAAI